MNKKIKTILFTLFVAGLLTVSCSSKDKTGPSSDNGGGGTTTTIPTGIQDGEGVDTSYQYKYASTADYGGLELTLDGKLSQTLTTQDQLQISTSTDKDPNLQGEYVGGVLIKMPLLTQLGFKSDLIRILPKNIKRNPGYGYDIHAVYVINNTNPEERLEYVELQTTGIQFNANFITMNSDITLTKTEIVKEANKEPVTTEVVYALKENKIKTIEKASSVTPIAGTPVDPNY